MSTKEDWVIERAERSLSEPESTMTPEDAFRVAWFKVFNNSKNLQPGTIISSLGGETRQALSGLKSHHIERIRPDLLEADEPTFKKREISKLLMEFDKKLRV